jgi:hypothetical protein
MVYRLLHPTFDVSQWLRGQTVTALPVGAAIESMVMSALLAASDAVSVALVDR